MRQFKQIQGVVMRVFILGLLLLTGCATTAGYEKVLSSWVGQSADHLISTWGTPANSTRLSDGGRVLEYSNQRNIQIGGYTTAVPQTTYHNGTTSIYGNNGGSATGNYSGTSTTYVQQTTPIQNIAMQCATRFTVNAQGTITNWAWQGNDCKAKEPEKQNQQNTDQIGKQRAENIEEFKKIDAKAKAVCDKSEYAAFFLKTPCTGNQITLVYLADNTKISQEQKDIILKYRSEIDALSNARNALLRQVGAPADKRWADYMDSLQPEIDKYNLDLYNGVITWGEYNQRRKNLTAKLMVENRNIYPQPK